MPTFASSYFRTNSAHNDPLIFQLTDRGLFSEVNMLLSVITYCLLKRRRLVVDQSPFFAGQWADYFENDVPGYDGLDPESLQTSYEGNLRLLKVARDYNRKRHESILPIWLPGIGFYANVRMLQRQIASTFAKPKGEVSRLFREPFATFHIRRGDKVEGYISNNQLVIEGEETPIQTYLNILEKEAPDIRSIFVMTDDYRAVEEVRKLAPSFQIKTSCSSCEQGYRQTDFNELSAAEKKENAQRIVSDVRIACEASVFIGGLKSNIASFITLTHPTPSRCISIDSLKEWRP